MKDINIEEYKNDLDPKYGTLYIGGNLSTNLAVMGNVEIAGDLINSKVMASGKVIVRGNNDDGIIEEYRPNMEEKRSHFKIDPYGESNGFLMFSGNIYSKGYKYDDMNLDICTDSYVWNEFGTTSTINCHLEITDKDNNGPSFDNMAGTVIVKDFIGIDSSSIDCCINNENDEDENGIVHEATFVIDRSAAIRLENMRSGDGIHNTSGTFVIVDPATAYILTKHKHSNGVKNCGGVFLIGGKLMIESDGDGFINHGEAYVTGQLNATCEYNGIYNDKKFVVKKDGSVAAWVDAHDDNFCAFTNKDANLVVDGKMNLYGTTPNNAIKNDEGSISGCGTISTHTVYFKGDKDKVEIEEGFYENSKTDTKLTVNGVSFYFSKNEVDPDKVKDELIEFSTDCDDTSYVVYYDHGEMIIY